MNHADHGKSLAYLQTGQTSCHDADGNSILCTDSGQDAAFHTGQPWPQPRFQHDGDIVQDKLTGLIWPCNANLADFPLNWQEALDFVAALNTRGELGFNNWRLPNRRELRSLVSHQTRQPALPANHPFNNIHNIYWSSTTSLHEPDWAWALYLHKGAVGVGQKSFARFHVWPVTDAAS